MPTVNPEPFARVNPPAEVTLEIKKLIQTCADWPPSALQTNDNPLTAEAMVCETVMNPSAGVTGFIIYHPLIALLILVVFLMGIYPTIMATVYAFRILWNAVKMLTRIGRPRHS